MQSELWFWKRKKLLLTCCALAGAITCVAFSRPVLLPVAVEAAQGSSALPPLGRETGDELIPSRSRTLAPDFTLTDVQGRTITLSQYKGKVVLLDFWATTCGGCKVEVPWYVEFDRKYRDKGLTLIGVDMYGESPAIIRPFMAKWHMEYPVAVGSDALGQRFHLQEMPMTLLIDRSGRIAVSHVGIVDKAKFEDEIRKLLR